MRKRRSAVHEALRMAQLSPAIFKSPQQQIAHKSFASAERLWTQLCMAERGHAMPWIRTAHRHMRSAPASRRLLSAMHEGGQVLQLLLDVQLAQLADLKAVRDRAAVVVAIAGLIHHLHLRACCVRLTFAVIRHAHTSHVMTQGRITI